MPPASWVLHRRHSRCSLSTRRRWNGVRCPLARAQRWSSPSQSNLHSILFALRLRGCATNTCSTLPIPPSGVLLSPEPSLSSFHLAFGGIPFLFPLLHAMHLASMSLSPGPLLPLSGRAFASVLPPNSLSWIALSDGACPIGLSLFSFRKVFSIEFRRACSTS